MGGKIWKKKKKEVENVSDLRVDEFILPEDM